MTFSNRTGCTQALSKTRKGFWSAEEDDLLIQAVAEIGNDYTLIAERIPSRSIKQIRERWSRQLDPSIKRTKFTAEEDAMLAIEYSRWGPAWTKVAQAFDGRTASAVKNRYKVLLRRQSRDCLTAVNVSACTQKRKLSAVVEESTYIEQECCKKLRIEESACDLSFDTSAVLQILDEVENEIDLGDICDEKLDIDTPSFAWDLLLSDAACDGDSDLNSALEELTGMLRSSISQ